MALSKDIAFSLSLLRCLVMSSPRDCNLFSPSRYCSRHMSGWSLEYCVGRNNGLQSSALRGLGGLGRAVMACMSTSIEWISTSASTSSLTHITRLHITGNFLGPRATYSYWTETSSRSFSGSCPCSWLSSSSGTQLSLSLLMMSKNPNFTNENSMLLIEIHLVILDSGYRISVELDWNSKDISTILDLIVIIF